MKKTSGNASVSKSPAKCWSLWHRAVDSAQEEVAMAEHANDHYGVRFNRLDRMLTWLVGFTKGWKIERKKQALLNLKNNTHR